MNILDNLKLDNWWKAILWIGVLTIIASFFFSPDFLQNKHLFGFGLGLVCVGIAYWIAEQKFTDIKQANAYTGPATFISWTNTRHTPITGVILSIGIILALFFGFLIIKKLV